MNLRRNKPPRMNRRAGQAATHEPARGWVPEGHVGIVSPFVLFSKRSLRLRDHQRPLHFGRFPHLGYQHHLLDPRRPPGHLSSDDRERSLHCGTDGLRGTYRSGSGHDRAPSLGLAGIVHADDLHPPVCGDSPLWPRHLGLHRGEHHPRAGLHIPNRIGGRMDGGCPRRHRLGQTQGPGVRLGTDGLRWRHADRFAPGRAARADQFVPPLPRKSRPACHRFCDSRDRGARRQGSPRGRCEYQPSERRHERSCRPGPASAGAAP